MLTLEEIYPPYGLTISSGALTMRVLRDDDIPELVDLIASGVQVPGLPMPFIRDWHAGPLAPGTPDGFPTTSLAWWWTQRASFAPENWKMALAVRLDGELVGMQDMNATDFPHTRSVETGSWLGLRHQGKGVGTLMRQLVVGFAFDELGATACHSGYVSGNEASAAVSRKVGYSDNGLRHITQTIDGKKMPVMEYQVRVTPESYNRPSQDVTVQGAEQLRNFLGINH